MAGLERLAAAARLADLDLVARLELVRRDVRRRAVDGEVAVADELAGLGPRRGEAHPEDDVVEPQLERPEEALAGDAGVRRGDPEVVPELALEDAVDAADLLLLAQLQAVLADLAAADGVLAGRRRAAARTSTSSCSSACPSGRASRPPGGRGGRRMRCIGPCVPDSAQTRRRLGARQPLCGMGVMSVIAETSRPAAWSDRIACSRPAPGPFT